MTRIVALDLGGTKIAAAVKVDGTWSELQTALTPAEDGAEAILDMMATLARSVGGDEITAVGVGAAGSIDSETGVVIASTDTLRGWTGTDVRAGLAARLGLNIDHVVVENDVHAHARGEALEGAGAGARTMLMLAVGTGIGGAIVHDGEVFGGSLGTAGAFAHIPVFSNHKCTCGRTGHLEAVAAGPAIGRAWATASGNANADARDAVSAARAGDKRAVVVLRHAGIVLGAAIAGLVASIDADRVVIGGGVAEAGDIWWEAVRAGFMETATDAHQNTTLEPARLGTRAALVGAAATAQQSLLEDRP